MLALESFKYSLKDHILPNTGRSKHVILQLKYLSALKIMENENDIIKILSPEFLPARLFEPLLQSVILKCYLKFINSDRFPIQQTFNLDRDRELHQTNETIIPFPETLGILVLNWPYEEFILRNQLPSLEPPVDIFLNRHYQFAICEWNTMLRVFNVFCIRLIKFIIRAIVVKCTTTNPQGMTSCCLRRLDVSGLVNTSPLQCRDSADIIEGIRNSTIDTFGHKIEIYADAGQVGIEAGNEVSKLCRNIIEQSLKPDKGVYVYFKTINVGSYYYSDTLPDDFSKLLVRGRCEYIHLSIYNIDQISFNIDRRKIVESLCVLFPGLVGLGLHFREEIENLDFINSFQYLDQLCIRGYSHNITNALCKMSKGLKHLSLYDCSLMREDFECLATSIHLNTLLKLFIINNKNTNDFEAVGLVTLCQSLKNVKVFIFDNCSLETLPSKSVYKLVNAFKDCDQLEILSLKLNPFILELTHIIIDGLAQNTSLRYLSLDLPKMPRSRNGILNEDKEGYYNENMKYQQNLCKIFHVKINVFRHSPIYISWKLDSSPII